MSSQGPSAGWGLRAAATKVHVLIWHCMNILLCHAGIQGTKWAVLLASRALVLQYSRWTRETFTVYECLLDEDTVRDETYLSMLQLGVSCGSSKKGWKEQLTISVLLEWSVSTQDGNCWEIQNYRFPAMPCQFSRTVCVAVLTKEMPYQEITPSSRFRVSKVQWWTKFIQWWQWK